jgi:peptidoglycan-associated lipoprotein
MSKTAFFQVIGLVMVAGALVGCKTRDPWSVYGGNPAGISGEGVDYVGVELGDNRLADGDEHAGMFTSVYFGYNSNVIDSSEIVKLEEVSSYLSKNKDVAMIVEGHCDERGSREYNLALGERRALAVREYLIGLGVAADRVQTRTMGEEQPAVDGHDESAWSQNRRAEFIVYY